MTKSLQQNYGLFLGACGLYGAYFKQWPPSKLKNIGNIEMCYKLCKFETGLTNCKFWTYNVKNLECDLYYESVTGGTTADKSEKFVIEAFNFESNPKITGPSDCGY